MKIVITGTGMISAAGVNLDETLITFQSGKRNAGPVSIFPTSLSYPVFEVKNLPEKLQTGSMRTISLALCAAQGALDDADLPCDLSNFRVGVCLGTTVASQLNDTDFYRALRNSKDADMAPVDRYLGGNLSEAVAHRFKANGPSLTVVNACSSGADAIGVGISWLKTGLCDMVIAGGADELNLIPLCGFASLGILSDSLCAPFDRDRTGLNLGEGAGILVLETEKMARKRGVFPSLYLSGYGAAGDAYHLTAPRPDGAGLLTAIKKALAEAGIGPQDVCFVNAHGTATLENDKVEGSVLLKLFGSNVKFYSTKGFTGHTLGAAGGLEAAFTACALKKGWIPPSIGFVNIDNDILIRPVEKKTDVNGYHAVSTSLAFGGNNTALVISRGKNTD